MGRGPRAPSAQQILDIAEDYGIDMTLVEAGEHAGLMGGAIAAYRRIEDLPAVRPPVKYPRDPGHRPVPSDNPCNGWYWRCEIAGNADGPLAGARVAIKDTVCVAGLPMAIGSRLLDGFVPDIDATIVTRLLDAGATIVGKTNVEDLSFSGGGHTSISGPVQNPRKPTHSPGGSSSGSAVVLATGQVDMAIGGDQGGSIRIPAAWSGVYGLKQTYGLVPYTGCASIEMTVDHIGPMGNSCRDVARLLAAMAGPDPLDPRQRGVAREDVGDYVAALDRGAGGLKVGVVTEGFGQPAWEDIGLPASEVVVDDHVRAAAQRFEGLGATVEDVSIPMHREGPYLYRGVAIEGATDAMLGAYGLGSNWTGYYNLGLAEAFARGWRARPNDLPATVRMVLLMGTYMRRHYHGRYYAIAQNARHGLTAAYDDALGRYDVLVMPTVPFRAQPLPPADPPLAAFLEPAETLHANTCQANLTGHPAMSVPCGLADGLPIGMMLVGRRFDEATVLAAAAAFEATGDWRAM